MNRGADLGPGDHGRLGTDDTPHPSVPDEQATVLVPTNAPPSEGEVAVELRTLVDGRLGLLVYSSLDRLVSCCGEFQPWMEVPTSSVDELARSVGADVAVADVTLEPELRHAQGRR